MTKNEIIEALSKIDVTPNKKLGQNFIKDPNITDLITKTMQPVKDEHILEIGPGTGVITKDFVEAGCQVTAIEFDWRLAEFMRLRFANDKNFRLIESDACKVDYDEIMGTEPYRCVANLPYSVSSVLVSILMAAQNYPQQIFVMLQKEMAERLAAKPNTKAYGSLSVRLQALYDVTITRKISKKIFHPSPDVDSALLNATLRPNSEPLSMELRQRLDEVTKLAFSQRRKQVKKMLGQRFQTPFVLEFFKQNNISETVRAEQLTVDQFINFAKATLEDKK